MGVRGWSERSDVQLVKQACTHVPGLSPGTRSQGIFGHASGFQVEQPGELYFPTELSWQVLILLGVQVE